MNENRITIRIDDGKFYVFKLCADGMLKLADRHDLKDDAPTLLNISGCAVFR